MPYNDPKFPEEQWDGLTNNRNRIDLNSNVNPNSDDWERIAAEVIAMQQYQLSGPGVAGGFMDYNDTSTSITLGTPVTISTDTWVTVPNDGLGSFTNKAYAPQGVTELMDTSTGALDFSQLNLGDTCYIRNDFVIIPDTNNASLEARYKLGGGAGEYTLKKSLGRLDRGSGIEYQQSLVVDMIYMGDLNTRDNPGVLQIKLSTTGSLINNGSAISIVRYTG